MVNAHIWLKTGLQLGDLQGSPIQVARFVIRYLGPRRVKTDSTTSTVYMNERACISLRK